MADDKPKIIQVELENAPGTTGTPEERILALERQVANLSRQGSDIRGIVHFQSFSADPTKCSIGDLAVVGGKLKVCTAANTWTIVGTQT